MTSILQVVNGARVTPAKDASSAGGTDYLVKPDGLFWLKQTPNGPAEVPLTNFQARITAQVERNDGLEIRRALEIEATLRGRSRTFVLPAEQFPAMNWPLEHLGAGAVVYPGIGVRDRARAAIQILSGDPPSRVVYTHTGWTKFGEDWFYVHGAGAIGRDGSTLGASVELPTALKAMCLPSPPEGEDLRGAIRTSLRLEILAPGRVMWPIVAGVYRSVLGPCDFAVHVVGRTGTGKTELAALAQQHFGATLDARSLPAAWSSTGNALEALAFYAKDALLVVDDFAPGGTPQDVARQHQQAERFLRAQGNASGRGRMAADGTLRSVRPPRGLTLSTGEDVPRGESLRARILVLEVQEGDVNWSLLSQSQADAQEGWFASALAGYVRWLAPMYEVRRAKLREEVDSIRFGQAGRGHRRTSTTEANLIVGIQNFLAFALDVGAIDQATFLELEKRATAAIRAATDAQAAHQVDADPVARFLDLLPTALSSGQAHVVMGDGSAPACPAAWGWRREPGRDWQPQGLKVGWLEGEDLFLDQNAAYRAAQSVVGNSAEGLPLAVRTLARRLHERGMLRSVDPAGGRMTVRRSLEGTRRHVLHLASSTINESASPGRDGFEESLA